MTTKHIQNVTIEDPGVKILILYDPHESKVVLFCIIRLYADMVLNECILEGDSKDKTKQKLLKRALIKYTQHAAYTLYIVQGRN